MDMAMVLDWRSVGSLIATIMVLRTAVRDFLPPEAELYLRRLIARVAAAFRGAKATIIIDEADGANSGANDLYDAAQLYLGACCLATAPVVRLHKPRQAHRPVASLPDAHTTHDTFQGVRVKWTSTARPVERGASGAGFNPYIYGRASGGGGGGDQRSLQLQFPRQHRDLIHNQYIPHLIDEATKMRLKSRERRLYTNRAGAPGDDHHRLWTSHTFSHPSTFDTLAVDPALREDIRADLLRFASRREHYARVGRAWKRGYLLHGPPGTGKTSLVAAIANLLEFDVYDLELTTVPSNSHLRRLLVSTTPKSVVVVEDIDCSLDLSDRKKKGSANTSDEEKAQLAVLSPAAAAAMAAFGGGIDKPLRSAQLRGRALVVLCWRAPDGLHDQPPGAAGPGAAPSGPHGPQDRAQLLLARRAPRAHQELPQRRRGGLRRHRRRSQHGERPHDRGRGPARRRGAHHARRHRRGVHGLRRRRRRRRLEEARRRAAPEARHAGR